MRKESGFTIMELMVTIAIILIMASLPFYPGCPGKD
jgi:prepilin-type N-terminal cleavage/methylation domain-containing protein